LTAETIRTGTYCDDGHRSPVSWVAAIANCDRRSAGRQVRNARVLTDLALAAAAYAAGDIGDDQLVLLGKLHANPRCRALLPDSQDLLVGYAQTLTYPEFEAVCKRWEAHADPDGKHADHETSRANRGVSTTQIGAGFELNASGDALSGEVITEILDQHAEAEYLTDVAEREARYGDDAELHPLERDARQRRYDALYAIFLKAAATTDTTNRLPLVTIHCTQHVLEDAIRTYFGRPTLNDPSERMRLCETDSGAPVDLYDLAVAALIGQVQRIVSDPNGRPIHLGRRSRLFVGAAREAVLLMGDRCTQPGCHIRGRPVQIDHTTPWAMHGHTNANNGGPACGHHNRYKHNQRVTVMRDETGWHHYRPDGTEIAPRTQP